MFSPSINVTIEKMHSTGRLPIGNIHELQLVKLPLLRFTVIAYYSQQARAQPSRNSQSPNKLATSTAASPWAVTGNLFDVNEFDAFCRQNSTAPGVCSHRSLWTLSPSMTWSAPIPTSKSPWPAKFTCRISYGQLSLPSLWGR